jgi:hypothetical protein
MGVYCIINTQHPTPNTQHPTPNTQHPTPNTQHPTPNIDENERKRNELIVNLTITPTDEQFLKQYTMKDTKNIIKTINENSNETIIEVLKTESIKGKNKMNKDTVLYFLYKICNYSIHNCEKLLNLLKNYIYLSLLPSQNIINKLLSNKTEFIEGVNILKDLNRIMEKQMRNNSALLNRVE